MTQQDLVWVMLKPGELDWLTKPGDRSLEVITTQGQRVRISVFSPLEGLEGGFSKVEQTELPGTAT